MAGRAAAEGGRGGTAATCARAPRATAAAPLPRGPRSSHPSASRWFLPRRPWIWPQLQPRAWRAGGRRRRQNGGRRVGRGAGAAPGAAALRLDPPRVRPLPRLGERQGFAPRARHAADVGVAPWSRRRGGENCGDARGDRGERVGAGGGRRAAPRGGAGRPARRLAAAGAAGPGRAGRRALRAGVAHAVRAGGRHVEGGVDAEAVCARVGRGGRRRARGGARGPLLDGLRRALPGGGARGARVLARRGAGGWHGRWRAWASTRKPRSSRTSC